MEAAFTGENQQGAWEGKLPETFSSAACVLSVYSQRLLCISLKVWNHQEGSLFLKEPKTDQKYFVDLDYCRIQLIMNRISRLKG